MVVRLNTKQKIKQSKQKLTNESMTVWRNRHGLSCHGGRGTERRIADSKGDTLQNVLK